MKRLAKVIFVLTLALVASCKDQPKKKEKENPQNERSAAVDEELTNRLQVFLDGKFHAADTLQLSYFTEMEDGEVRSSAVVAMPNNWQRVKFILPFGVLPDSIRIDMATPNTLDLEKIVFNIDNDRLMIKDRESFDVHLKLKGPFEMEEMVLKVESGAVLYSSEVLNQRLKTRYLKYFQ